MVHLAEKPVELAVQAMGYSSREGENILDLFGGSGSTLIACEQTNRHAFLMEIDPAYCNVIVQRWEEFTVKKAERIAANALAGETPAAFVAGVSPASQLPMHWCCLALENCGSQHFQTSTYNQ